jgi:hypothetical protein
MQGVFPTADVALTGVQEAASIKEAILALFSQGHRAIGIGRHGAVEVAQTAHRHRIQLPDGLVLVGGHVRNGLWHTGNGNRVVGGLWQRDDPLSSDGAIFRVGDVDNPREEVAFEGVRTWIGPDAGKSTYPYDIRNGARVRVRDCEHRSEAPPLPIGDGVSGQAFCVGAGAWDVEISNNRATVVSEDDFCNFSSSFRRSGRVRVTGNIVAGFDSLAAAVDCEGLVAIGNQGTACRRVFFGKAAWYSAGPHVVRGVCLEANQLFDGNGALWLGVAMLLAGDGGLIEDVLINGAQVHAHPAGPGTNMIFAMTREGGIVRDLRATNVNVTTEAPLARLLATRGPGVMRDFELYDWRIASGGVGQLYDIQGGFVPGTWYHHNVRVAMRADREA